MRDEDVEAYLDKYNIPKKRSLMPLIWMLAVVAVGVVWVNFSPPQIAPWWDCRIGSVTKNMSARIRLLDSCLQDGAQSDRDRAFSHFMRGNAYLATNRAEDALADYNAAIGLRRDFADAYYNRSGIYRDRKNTRRALQDLDRAIQLKPNDTQALMRRGYIYINSGNIAQAIRDYSRTIAIDPNSDVAFSLRGYAHGYTGNHQHAADDFTAAINIAPDKALYHYYRAIAYDQQGRLADAVRDINIAIDLSDTRVDAPSPADLSQFYDGFNYIVEGIAAANQTKSNLAVGSKGRLFLVYVYAKMLKTAKGSVVRNTQAFLAENGHYDGPVDGILRDDIVYALNSCAISPNCDLNIDPEDGLQ